MLATFSCAIARSGVLALLALPILPFLAAARFDAPKRPYAFAAAFVEGCSCKGVCTTEITGVDVGCHGIAAIRFDQARFDGKDFSGTRAAWAFSPAGVRLYIDVPADQPDKRAALTEFLRAALADWGKLDSVTPATVTISEGRNEYGALVGSGDIARLRVTPVLGADGKTGVRLSNLRSVFHDSLMQGIVASASYKGAGTPFSLSGTSGFYNGHCVMKGEL